MINVPQVETQSAGVMETCWKCGAYNGDTVVLVVTEIDGDQVEETAGVYCAGCTSEVVNRLRAELEKDWGV